MEEWRQGEYLLSTDPARVDLRVVHGYLATSYWASGIPREVVAHPRLQGFRRTILATRDAHGLYRQVGFTPLAAPDRWMERWTPDAYARVGR